MGSALESVQGYTHQYQLCLEHVLKDGGGPLLPLLVLAEPSLGPLLAPWPASSLSRLIVWTSCCSASTDSSSLSWVGNSEGSFPG